MRFGSIYGHTAVVSHMPVGARCIVEQGCLTAVRITHQRYIDGTALFHGLVVDIIVLVAMTIGSQVKGCCLERCIG